MARIKRNAEKWHRLTIATDRNDGIVTLVKGGNGGMRAYLWAGANAGIGCVTVSGRKTLRKLAHAILAEVGTR